MGYSAISSNGSTYNATSDKAVNFISNAAAGSTMTGGDGSSWTKNADGSTTVRAADGVTTTFNAPSSSSGSSSSPGYVASSVSYERDDSSPSGYRQTGSDYSSGSSNLSYSSAPAAAQSSSMAAGTSGTPYSSKMPDMSQRTDLAGMTVYRNGMNVTYDANGYAVSAVNPNHSLYAGTERAYYAPSYDAVMASRGGTDRSQYGGSDYDKQYFTDAQLQRADQLRADAAAGKISWDDANRYAEDVRASYGYSGGRDGSQYIAVAPENYWNDGWGGNYNPNGLGAGTTYAQAYQNGLIANGPTNYASLNTKVNTAGATPAYAATSRGVTATSPTYAATSPNVTATSTNIQTGAAAPATLLPFAQPGENSTRVASTSDTGYQPAGSFNDAILSKADQQEVQNWSNVWFAWQKKYQEAKANGDAEGMAEAQAGMNEAHAQAEAIRAKDEYGYSGGYDGSQYLPFGKVTAQSQNIQTGQASPNGVGPLTNRAPELQSLLDQMVAAQQQQATNQVDYATQRGINELTRAEQDAAAQYQEQRNQVAADEARALDNMALYNERRGDRGGIGQAQYNSIMNTAAQNQLSVNNAQTKLSTDTARQIADLRAQGEYEKADKLLEISQNYLSQLIDLQQWAAQFNLSVDQFNKELEQWNLNYETQIADLLGTYRGQQTLASRAQDFDQAYKTASLTGVYNGQPTLQARSALAEAGIALAQAGIMPSESQIDAMKSLYGYDSNAVGGLVQTAQLAQQAKIKAGSGGSGSSSGKAPNVKVDPVGWLEYYGLTDPESARDALIRQGFDEDDAAKQVKKLVDALDAADSDAVDDMVAGLAIDFMEQVPASSAKTSSEYWAAVNDYIAEHGLNARTSNLFKDYLKIYASANPNH